MRSAKEIGFRVRQELANLAMLVRTPRQHPEAETVLPDPHEAARRLAGTPFAAEMVKLAEQIREHRFPLLGGTVETGAEIRWRRDYRSGKETGTGYFRLIPYLDAARAGDHKNIWELNRHQHLVLLAQVSLITGEEVWVDEIVRELESWWGENPFQRGINWASALEVGFRALSWMWVHRMVGARLPDRFLEELYRHGCHLEKNLSVYFSPNTHLLGEAVALHALGRMFKVTRWEETGGRTVREEMRRQVREDGSHFEQSMYYHVYALDMFLFHGVLAGMDEEYLSKIERMAEYLDALMGSGRRLPFLGDDDGGRLFHPYGRRDEFGRATLATCGVVLKREDWIGSSEELCEQAVWCLGEAAAHIPSREHRERLPRLFVDAGVAVFHDVLVDVGPFGRGRAGHSHSDTLSIVVRSGGEEVLIDPGTYTYAEPEWRERFRGSGAHNTMRIDGRDQAVARGAFRWSEPPAVRVLNWSADSVEAECRYNGLCHRRRVTLETPERLVIVDEVEGHGEHTVERFWHAGGRVEELGGGRFRIGAKAVLTLGAGTVEQGWRSPTYGVKESSPVIREIAKVTLPIRWTAVIEL